MYAVLAAFLSVSALVWLSFLLLGSRLLAVVSCLSSLVSRLLSVVSRLSSYQLSIV